MLTGIEMNANCDVG